MRPFPTPVIPTSANSAPFHLQPATFNLQPVTCDLQLRMGIAAALVYNPSLVIGDSFLVGAPAMGNLRLRHPFQPRPSLRADSPIRPLPQAARPISIQHPPRADTHHREYPSQSRHSGCRMVPGLPGSRSEPQSTHYSESEEPPRLAFLVIHGMHTTQIGRNLHCGSSHLVASATRNLGLRHRRELYRRARLLGGTAAGKFTLAGLGGVGDPSPRSGYEREELAPGELHTRVGVERAR